MSSGPQINKKSQIFIIGAGLSGRAIAAEIRKNSASGEVTAFVDDDPKKIGTSIGGIPVLGPISQVPHLCTIYPAQEVLIAIPSASREQLKRIYHILHQCNFNRIRILPTISQIIEGDAHLVQTRVISPEDVLAREPIRIGLKESLTYLRGKRVLITGAGGSIGSELCRQLLYGGAQRLYLLGHGENSIYGILRELTLLQEAGVGEKSTIVPIIGELQDSDYVHYILSKLKADIIFHAAAHKHVPMMEQNPVEAIKNNLFSTINLVNAAIKHEIGRFILISTDKAVEPACIYGVSKFLSEYYVLQKNSDGRDFMVVRFGNVLGSRGSILPLFQEQISKGGPITITHPDTSRYFMTVPEAASLVLKAGGVGSGGNCYLLDMGKPVAIQELAIQMLKFYGLEPGKDIAIEYVGMRPGEKLHEVLWAHHEQPLNTEYPHIFRIQKNNGRIANIDGLITELYRICYFNKEYPQHYRNSTLLRQVLHAHLPAFAQSQEQKSAIPSLVH